MIIPLDSLTFDLIFAVLLTISIPLIGISVLHFVASRIMMNPFEKFIYGAGIGVGLYAVIGLIVGILPSFHQPVAIVLIVAINIWAIGYWLKEELLVPFIQNASVGLATIWAAWLIMVLVCIVFSSATIKFPDDLFDGPYVIKNHNLHVKVQTMTGHLPADNYLPYLVSEFFLRGISFKEERPLMPGQEIANRPILMALITIPFRAALDPPPRRNNPLPKFQYLGTWWPDVGILGEDRYFRQFLVVGIVLNAMIILGAALLFNSSGLTNRYSLAGLLLIIANPYFISQVIFTWPKALAAFYLLLAIHALSVRKWTVISGVLTALAYLSHPYAVVFAGSFTLALAWKSQKMKLLSQPVVHYLAAFAATIAPWFIWTKLYLKIPSDLVSQNLLTGGSLANMAWVRVYNFYETVFPRFLEIFPFNGDQILQNSLVCIPGIVGIVFIIQAYAGCRQFFNEHQFFVVFGIFVPGLLLILLFSIPAVPAIHGFQAIGPILILLSMKWMQNNTNIKILYILVATQLIINVAMLEARADTLGIFNNEQSISEVSSKDSEFLLSKADINHILTSWPVIDTVNATIPPNVGVPVEISGSEKISIWMNPSAALIFRDLELGNSPQFHTFISIHPSVWNEAKADGAIFRIAVISDGKEEVLLEKEINPFINVHQKKWTELLIDLKRFENKRIDIMLSVTAGPADNAYADWCIWGEPVVTSGSVAL